MKIDQGKSEFDVKTQKNHFFGTKNSNQLKRNFLYNRTVLILNHYYNLASFDKLGLWESIKGKIAIYLPPLSWFPESKLKSARFQI
jgi:hypothetical protein